MKEILEQWKNVLDLYHSSGYIHFCQNLLKWMLKVSIFYSSKKLIKNNPSGCCGLLVKSGNC